MMNNKHKTYELLLLEIQDAKTKAFDKILHIILESNEGDAFLKMNGVVLKVYTEYKQDVQRILKMYMSPKFSKDPSITTFLNQILEETKK